MPPDTWIRPASFRDHLGLQISDLQEQIDRLQKVRSLIERFPDLHEEIDADNHRWYVSAGINAIATGCFVNHGCGCCTVTPLYARPYAEFDGIRIFSCPREYVVGQRFGPSYYPAVDATAGLGDRFPPVVFEIINQFFTDHPLCTETQEEQIANS